MQDIVTMLMPTTVYKLATRQLQNYSHALILYVLTKQHVTDFIF